MIEFYTHDENTQQPRNWWDFCIFIEDTYYFKG